MQISLRERLEQFSHLNQTVLFGRLEQQVGALSEKGRLLVSVLGMISLSGHVAPSRLAWTASQRSTSVGRCLSRQSRPGIGNDPSTARAATSRPAIALLVRLAFGASAAA
jgi:hypothetical protein